uniref:RRM domain-containing protein n=1 Tax=Macrostomum lignano TaxID=282301 RepID=A0A1I8HP67_9PLAT
SKHNDQQVQLDVGTRTITGRSLLSFKFDSLGPSAAARFAQVLANHLALPPECLCCHGSEGRGRRGLSGHQLGRDQLAESDDDKDSSEVTDKDEQEDNDAASSDGLRSNPCYHEEEVESLNSKPAKTKDKVSKVKTSREQRQQRKRMLRQTRMKSAEPDYYSSVVRKPQSASVKLSQVSPPPPPAALAAAASFAESNSPSVEQQQQPRPNSLVPPNRQTSVETISVTPPAPPPPPRTMDDAYESVVAIPPAEFADDVKMAMQFSDAYVQEQQKEALIIVALAPPALIIVALAPPALIIVAPPALIFVAPPALIIKPIVQGEECPSARMPHATEQVRLRRHVGSGGGGAAQAGQPRFHIAPPSVDKPVVHGGLGQLGVPGQGLFLLLGRVGLVQVGCQPVEQSPPSAVGQVGSGASLCRAPVQLLAAAVVLDFDAVHRRTSRLLSPLSRRRSHSSNSAMSVDAGALLSPAADHLNGVENSDCDTAAEVCCCIGIGGGGGGRAEHEQGLHLTVVKVLLMLLMLLLTRAGLQSGQGLLQSHPGEYRLETAEWGRRRLRRWRWRRRQAAQAAERGVDRQLLMLVVQRRDDILQPSD